MARVSRLVIVPPLVFAGIAALFIWGMARENPDQLPTALAGQTAPAVQVVALGAGPALTDADLRDGRVKLVNFWASWCAPCRAEHPSLMQLAAEGVPIYGVNYKDTPDKAQKFLDELGNPFEKMGADTTGRMGLMWGLYGVPETYLIDGEGRILLRHAGPITERVIEGTIRPALEAAR
jgi:cytochrome c biogenesis protein CcmG/thiol:disulfide interchange protein DsbE